ncbi:MAG: SMC-Scp complex subunit ScpB [Coriobacteriales bacterium]|jgi:segregation and condensation protein B|nr:SMC-Scp complex subunit ScpB [Coriobacteriales bacterium]
MPDTTPTLAPTAPTAPVAPAPAAPAPAPAIPAPASTQATPTTDDYPLEGAVEALLFVSDEPVSAATLAKILNRNPTEVDTVLSSLSTRFEEEERGIQLREVAGGWRLYSHPAFHSLIERYVISWDTRSLSQAALEALAVIAYHQPTTRAAVNGIRGVNSDAVISSLVEKGLVREAGRDSGPGNAILYATTRTFLEKFGLRSLRELPPLEEFAPDEESREYIRARLSAGRPPAPSKGDDEYEDEDEYRDEDGTKRRQPAPNPLEDTYDPDDDDDDDDDDDVEFVD